MFRRLVDKRKFKGYAMDLDLLSSHPLVRLWIPWASTSSRLMTSLWEDESPWILNFYQVALSTLELALVLYGRKTVTTCTCYITFYSKFSNSMTICLGQLNLNCIFSEYTRFFTQ